MWEGGPEEMSELSRVKKVVMQELQTGELLKCSWYSPRRNN